MATRDEQAAIDGQKRKMLASITRAEHSQGPCRTCGVVDLLYNEVWKLDHPGIVTVPRMSKRAAATFSAIGAGIGVGIAKVFGL